MILDEVKDYLIFRDFELPMIILGVCIVAFLILWFIYKVATYFEKR